MNWKNLFTTSLLQRGKDVYDMGEIQKVTLSYDNNFYVTVGRYVKNNVIINVKNNSVNSMYCNCPYGAKKSRCFHEVAALYAIEERYPEMLGNVNNTQKIVRIYPFRNVFDSQYYFDLDRICKNEQIFDLDYNRAEKLVNNGNVYDFSAELTYYRDELCLAVNGYVLDGNARFYNRIIINNKEIVQRDCGNYGCRSNYTSGYYFGTSSNICVHQLALLIKTRDYILANNPGDFTDYRGQQFLDNFAYLQFDDETKIKRKNDVYLVPRIAIANSSYSLNFRIGTEKLYVVKDLTDLVEQVEKKQTMELGVNNSIDFAYHYFSEKSQQYYDFIRKHVNDASIKYSLNPYSGSETIRRDISLYGHKLDEFYDLAVSEKLDIETRDWYGKGKGKVAFRDYDPKVELVIDKLNDDEGNFIGVKLTGEIPELIMGNDYAYYYKNNYINRVSKKMVGVIRELYNSNSQRNELYMNIGKRNLGKFYHNTLPALKNIVSVQQNDYEEIEKYLPEKAEFTFWLDVDDLGYANCVTEVNYGNIIKTLFYDNPTEDYRDSEKENLVKEVVKKYFPLTDSENQALKISENADDAIYRLLEKGIDELLRYGEVKGSDSFNRLKIKRKPKVAVGVSVNSNLLELQVLSQDISLEELADVIKSYKAKKQFHRLKSGEFVNMEDQSIEALALMLDELNISVKEFVKGKLHIPAYRSLYLDKLLEDNDLLYANRDQRFKKLIKEFKTINQADYEVPASLDEIMRNYQKTGYKWLKLLDDYHFGGILADDMGLGKTLQIIAVLLNNKQEKGYETSLVVTPASLVYNWQHEFKRFAPELSVGIVSGNQQERKEIIGHYGSYDVLITSYDLLKRDIENYENINFRYQIIDEAQYIKTHTTANAKSVKVIKAQTRYALTGTPIENNLSELWSIFDYLMPGFLYGYETFRKNIETKIAKEENEEVSQRLKRMIAPFILRRKKKDVLKDLPDKIEEIISVKFERIQQQLYDSQVVKMTNMLRQSDEKEIASNRISILADLMRIRRICCEPALVYENYDGESAKREAAIELIKSAVTSGHKILLFSQFKSMLEVLAEKLKAENIEYYTITGDTKKEERVRLVDNFNENEVPVFLISLKAGGTGLNLTGADIVIHYDPWWNLAAQNQATDRAHRIGQDKVVTVYKLIAASSIEEKIVELQNRKYDLAEAVLNGENGNLASLSKDDLLELLTE